MKKNPSILISLLVLSLFLIIFQQNVFVNAEPEMIGVPDDYLSIFDAVGNASEGDKIYVKSGIYEGPTNQTLVINKAISLIAERNTILNLHPLPINSTLFLLPI